VAHLEGSSRVGRSQGASIFWGVISVCFAAAACFYFWENHKNETTANVMRDQVLQLREENETLNSQKAHLQASKSEAENQLKTREDLIAEKEAKVAAEETRLEGLGRQSQNQSQQNQAQVTVVKKFNDMIRKLGSKDSPADVVERGGRPVLRIPNAQLFAPGDATLKPEGKALLNQIVQALNGQLDNFELRVVSYTDTDAEAQSVAATDQKTDSSVGPAAKPTPGANSDAKPHYASSWDLTAARASTLARFYRDQTSLPFLNVLVIGRGDSEPIVPNAKEGHARNRRVEITVTPLPVPFHAPDPVHDKTSAGSTTSAASAASVTPTPAPDSTASAGKDKAKDKNPPDSSATASKDKAKAQKPDKATPH
jgi:flagellar motor protein MotB